MRLLRRMILWNSENIRKYSGIELGGHGEPKVKNLYEGVFIFEIYLVVEYEGIKILLFLIGLNM